MDWMAWIASKHTLLVHLPAAAAFLIPLPILAAQRGGRGIRPWWITCRYLAWAGLIGSLLAAGSGLLVGRLHGHVPMGAFWGAADPGVNSLFRIHEAGGAACLLLAALCLRSLFRDRQEHQGIGLPALVLGLVWCATAMTTAYAGGLLRGHGPVPPNSQEPLRTGSWPTVPSPRPTPAGQAAPAAASKVTL